MSALLEHRLEALDYEEMAPRSTFASVEGRHVRYRLLGAERPGPTIVMLSGFGSTLEQSATAQAPLSQLAPVLAYDRAGTGLSDPSDGHDAVFEADELAALIQVTGAKPPVVLVSHSSAGLLARVFAARHAQLLAGLVFLDVTPPEHLVGLPWKAHYAQWAIYERGPLKLLLKSVFGWSRLRDRLFGPPAQTGVDAIWILERSSHWWAAYREGAVIARSAEEAELDWSKVQVPVIVVSSADEATDASSRGRLHLHREMAEHARGRHVSLPAWTHPQIAHDPKFVPVEIEIVEEVLKLARSSSRAAQAP